MPSNLLQLRRRAGFPTAREYCEHSGIPVPTYTRYESNPEKIPVASAWAIADDLGCTIDAVVGRTDLDEDGGVRGPVQAAYDAMTPKGKDSVDRFIRFIQAEEAAEADRRRSMQERLYEQLATQYELAMAHDRTQDTGFGQLSAYLSHPARRADFERYIRDLAAEKRAWAEEGGDEQAEERDENTVEQLMAAYDRLHGTAADGEDE